MDREGNGATVSRITVSVSYVSLSIHESKSIECQQEILNSTRYKYLLCYFDLSNGWKLNCVSPFITCFLKEIFLSEYSVILPTTVLYIFDHIIFYSPKFCRLSGH